LVYPAEDSQWELPGSLASVLLLLYNPIFITKGLAQLPACFMLVSCLAYFSTLKMEVIFFPEMSVDFH
jgi:hypothetical protein